MCQYSLNIFIQYIFFCYLKAEGLSLLSTALPNVYAGTCPRIACFCKSLPGARVSNKWALQLDFQRDQCCQTQWRAMTASRTYAGNVSSCPQRHNANINGNESRGYSQSNSGKSKRIVLFFAHSSFSAWDFCYENCFMYRSSSRP